MKNTRIFSSILLMVMIIPQIGLAQNYDNHEHTSGSTLKKELWRPLNKFEDHANNTVAVAAPLINVLEGVSFYSMPSVCNSEKVILLKLINSNNYPVLLTWKMSPESPEIIVEIPSKKDLEGSCSAGTNDVNKSKLVISVLEESVMEKAVKYALKHLAITKI